MLDARRHPQEFVRRAQEEERRAKRGKLGIFFGAAPGVGKTYAMLEAARTERDLKRDVVIGIVETHGRFDTAALVIGLEMLPQRKVDHHGIELKDFDLDAALQRKPGLVLVDELAHTNALGARHPKRWQDVEELLDAGIDVYTTLNVQHIESLNDVVAQVTGVIVRETVPDRIFEDASEVRLIDLPPDELLERLAEGRIYFLDQAERAVDSFFRKGNLIALRELALRRTAEHVGAQTRLCRKEQGIQRVWPAGERVLVGVSPSPASARLLRAARRMAGPLHAKFFAVYVEAPNAGRLWSADRERVVENLRLGEQLGAETVTLAGENPAQETIRWARAHNVTKIVVGKPTHARWRDLLRPSFLDQIVRNSGDIDVYVISGDHRGAPLASSKEAPKRPVRAAPYLASAAVVALSAVVAWFVFGRSRLTDVVMVYLFGIILVAMRFGSGPSLFAATLSVLVLDFFMIPPYLSFAVSDLRYIVTFGVMLFVAVVVNTLTQRTRNQAEAARSREKRAASLYALTRELAATRAVESLVQVAAQHIHDVFDARVAVLVSTREKDLVNVAKGPRSFEPDEKEMPLIQWVWRHDKCAGFGTDTLPSSDALYVPLRQPGGHIGVLGVMPNEKRRFLDPEQRGLLDVFGTQVASALERARLGEQAQEALIQAESERLRSSLLSSVSHDLRTPLGVITGATSALLVQSSQEDENARRELLLTIDEEAHRLNRLVRNLLDMTRITSGAIQVRKHWQPLENVVGAALTRMEGPLQGRKVDVRVPNDLPLVPIDDVLIEQVLINLLENATRYARTMAEIEIAAHVEESRVVAEVMDRGPGIPPEFLDRIFEKFYRLPREREGEGAGLGLAICRGIVVAHGGRIWAENREGGGAAFRFSLPIEGTPPIVSDEGQS